MPSPARAPGTIRWLRPKGNLTRNELAVLMAIAIVPLLMVLFRVAALPGVLGPGAGDSLPQSFGQQLDQVLSLDQIPAGDREGVLYLLFLPTGAMLIALARLTFGLRVIGFRSILISVGFQESGVVPSMILIAVVVGIVVGLRPTLVRFRLPYHARISVIMSIAVLTLLAALLLAPWLRSEVLWRVAFFPVIVLGLLAEGIAKTLDRANGMTAIWRTGMTIGIALILAGIGQVAVFREIAIRFPELVVTQIVGVILIAEFLDLRLLQHWDSRLSRMPVPRLAVEDCPLHVALVRNKRSSGVIGRLGPQGGDGPDPRTIRRVAAALRDRGHTVQVLEGDMKLLSQLRDFIPPHPRTGQPGGMVLNLSHGIQGDLPGAHVPAMLEMAGVPYTGPSPRGQLVTDDGMLLGALLEQAGVPAPRRRLVGGDADAPRFPVLVRPRHAGGRTPRLAQSSAELREAVRALTRGRDRQEVTLEPHAPGRELQVALLGNDPIERLPLLESPPTGDAGPRPVALDPALEQRVRRVAAAAFSACACRDHALATLRLTDAGGIEVLDIHARDLLQEDGAFRVAAAAAGLELGDLLERIVEIARARYVRAEPAPVLTLVPGLDGAARAPRSPLVAR